jgi:hypothetical protein
MSKYGQVCGAEEFVISLVLETNASSSKNQAKVEMCNLMERKLRIALEELGDKVVEIQKLNPRSGEVSDFEEWERLLDRKRCGEIAARGARIERLQEAEGFVARFYLAVTVEVEEPDEVRMFLTEMRKLNRGLLDRLFGAEVDQGLDNFVLVRKKTRVKALVKALGGGQSLGGKLDQVLDALASLKA